MNSLEESIKIAVESLGVKLYDTIVTKENDNNVFRVYITDSNGVTLDKCAEVSRMISPILDINEPLHGKYNLEVSSPGIERKLKKTEHYIASVGENIKVKDIATEIYRGKLIEADNDKIVINTEFGDEEISYDSILSASTYYEW